MNKIFLALLGFILFSSLPAEAAKARQSPLNKSAALAAAVSSATAPANDAKNAYMVDFDTGRVLYEKEGGTRMPTSSMSKMMTAYMVFEQLKEGHLHFDDKFPVSEHAWRTGGAVTESSVMFLQLNSTARVEDLLRGMIIQSGNDAAIVLAEGIGGSEQAFAERMNIKAQELGMSDSHFMNASGLPDPEHYSTARDLATLATRLINDFPEYYHFFSEKSFTWDGHEQGNRNPLLYRNIGVDGLKTGHAEEAGYGLTASGIESGHRLILVMNGLPSMQARADEPATLLEWGWHEYRLFDLFKPGEVMDEAPVWMGETKTVPVAVDRDAKLSLTNAERHDLKATIVYDGMATAPIAAGQKLGTIHVTAPNIDPIDIPLLATAAVPKLGAAARVIAALHSIFTGHA